MWGSEFYFASDIANDTVSRQNWETTQKAIVDLTTAMREGFDDLRRAMQPLDHQIHDNQYTRPSYWTELQ